MGSEVGDFAEKVDGGLGVPAFQFAVGRANAAQGPDPAVRALGLAGDVYLSQVGQVLFPALFETPLAQVIGIS